MELDLDAIEARANAATEGPWWRREGHAEIDGQNYAEVLIPGRVECGSYCYGGTSTIEGDRLDADLAFIAHARADVPDLVAEVRRLRERAEAHAVTVQQAVAVERQRDEARAEVERLTGALGAIAALPSASKPVRDTVRDALLDVRHDPSATTDGGSDV